MSLERIITSLFLCRSLEGEDSASVRDAVLWVVMREVGFIGGLGVYY